MPLNKITVPVSLGGPLDTKSDPRQVQAGLLQAQNVYMQRTGELRKVDGVTNIPGMGMVNPSQLSTFKNELLVQGSSFIDAYSTTLQTGVIKTSGYLATSLTTTPFSASQTSQNLPEIAVSGNILVAAWQDTANGIWVHIEDLTTGTRIYYGDLDSSGYAPRVITNPVDGNIWIFHQDGGQAIALHYVNVSSLNTSSPFTYVGQLVTKSQWSYTALPPTTGNSRFDVCSGPNYIYLTYVNSSSGVTINAYNNSFTQAATTSVASASFGSFTPGYAAGLTVFYGNNTVFGAVGCCNTGASPQTYNVQGYAFNATLSSTLMPTTVMGGTYDVGLISGIWDGSQFRLFYENVSYSSFNIANLSTITVSSAFAVGSETSLTYCHMSSKPALYNGNVYLLVCYDDSSALQTTYFLIDTSNNALAKVLPGVSGGRNAAGGSPAPIISYGTNQFALPVLQKTLVQVTQAGTTQSSAVTAACKTILNLAPSTLPSGAETANNLHLPGGVVGMYDGVSVVEHGFHLSPVLTYSVANSGGNLAQGTYYWIAVYEWTDAQGQIHRSAPSLAAHFTLSSAGMVATLIVSSLKFTQKKNNRSNAQIVIYRTIANGSTYYRCLSMANDPTIGGGATITFTDNVADSSLTTPLLYTNGGTLPNDAPPSALFLVAARDRLFGVSGENPNQIFYSRETVPGEGVSFSGELVINTLPYGGGITALGQMDDKIVFFKQSQTWFFSGDGPLDTGSQNQFTTPQVITYDIGCTNQQSVVLTPQGLMFQSQKGIYLLDRSLNMSYVGAAVEAYNSLTITGSLVQAQNNQVRFYTSNGPTLIYDYYFQRWFTRTGQACIGAAVWGQTPVFLTSAGTVAQEVVGQAGDNGSAVQGLIQTGWISLGAPYLGGNGLEGFQRIYKINILGQWVGNHVLEVQLSYDFQASVFETFYLVAGSSAFVSAQQATYPAGVVFTGTSTDGAYEFQIRPAQQKCSAIQLTISDVFPSGTVTKSWQLSAIAIEVGVKGGVKRLPAASLMRSV